MNGKEHLKQLAALFDRDHLRLLAMLDDVRHLAQKGSFLPAAKVFGELRLHQEHHLSQEEASLAALSQAGCCPRRLEERIAAEHRLLSELFERTAQEISSWNLAAVLPLLETLSRALTAHERGEKDELLPALCSAYSDSARLDAAVQQLVDP